MDLSRRRYTLVGDAMIPFRVMLLFVLAAAALFAPMQTLVYVIAGYLIGKLIWRIWHE